MELSQDGLNLIKHFEGCRLTAYPDEGAFSIGYGHRGVPQGSTCDQQQADNWLLQDTGTAQAAVNELVAVSLTQNQFDALVSFTYNVGDGAFRGSTLLRKLNLADYPGVSAEFGRWIHASGQVDPDLVERRKQEAALFAS